MHHEASLEDLTRLLDAEGLTQTLAHEFFQSQTQLFPQVDFLDESNHTLKYQYQLYVDNFFSIDDSTHIQLNTFTSFK